MPGILEDPLTGDFASRIELEDEEEAAIASNLPEQYVVQPTINVRLLIAPKQCTSNPISILITF